MFGVGHKPGHNANCSMLEADTSKVCWMKRDQTEEGEEGSDAGEVATSRSCSRHHHFFFSNSNCEKYHHMIVITRQGRGDHIQISWHLNFAQLVYDPHQLCTRKAVS